VRVLLLRGEELVLGPFQGKPACIRIRSAGASAGGPPRAGDPRVPDVSAFRPHHVRSASRSEIVVPIIEGDVLHGVLDVDAPEVGRFDREDLAGSRGSSRRSRRASSGETLNGQKQFGGKVTGSARVFPHRIPEGSPYRDRSLDRKQSSFPKGFEWGRLDVIAATHGHFDHFGEDGLALAKKTGATVVANFELALHCGANGVEKVSGRTRAAARKFQAWSSGW